MVGLGGVGGGRAIAPGRDVRDFVGGVFAGRVGHGKFGVEHGAFEFLDQGGGQVVDVDGAPAFGASESDGDCYGCHTSIVTEAVTKVN